MNKDENRLYVVWGSYKEGKFRLMNMRAFCQVNRRFFATMYYPESLSYLEQELTQIQKRRPEWKFKIKEMK